MSTLGIAPIVEGHGELQAIRTLLTRTVHELLQGPWPVVLPPIRQPRSKLVAKPRELERAVGLAALKLQQHRASFDHGLVLVLLDADDDPPCELAPRLLEQMRRDDVDTTCVLANPEYETWFVAAAQSLSEYLSIDDQPPLEPEKRRLKKGWIERRFIGSPYSPPIDQPRLTAAMDLSQCRGGSPSFDKLCRELERRLRGT
ncbi:DUF4276 family protein [Paraliomyxa miuraensis]|uniref:DUF4276 family protein n=1 Tax=Paraliomyxa miuraensis TaxID=376150 RepID=UPI002251C514|nr:DUF4276 family protein [Paraliomyxa miuraensis]MCX4244094.1 DUF4276 family protein [Paraliomyxa miuraensis]